MMLPTIHLNGTSRQELLRQMTDAHAALCSAIDAVCAMAPNGRDYYTQGPEALPQATREHRARVEALVGIRDEIQSMAEEVAFDD